MSILAAFSFGFTPTEIFVFLNIVIGTIALTSKVWSSQAKDNDDGNHPDRQMLARQPSALDRLRSFNFYRQYQDKAEEVEEVHSTPLLSRQPSLSERLRSFNLNLYQHYQHKAEEKVVVEEEDLDVHHFTNNNDQTPRQPQLSRRPSFLDRLKSIKLYGAGYGDAVPNETGGRFEPPEPKVEQEHDLNRSHSESSPLTKKAAVKKVTKKKLTKSFSEKCKSVETPEKAEAEFFRRPPTTREVNQRHRLCDSGSSSSNSSGDEEEDGGVVDAQSDDFINRFRQQLKLERLASILNRKKR